MNIKKLIKSLLSPKIYIILRNIYNSQKYFLRKIENFFLYFYFLRKQNIILAHIKKIKEEKKVIKVAFLHMYATDCQNLCIFEKLVKDSYYDPYFIINPDISRSKDNLYNQYNRSREMLINRYGKDRVIDGYDVSKEMFIDYSNEFDVMTTNNPYDHMAHKYFKISFWGKQNIPIFYISYFYMGRCYVTKENFQQRSFNFIWKIFVENESAYRIAQEVEILKGKNLDISGYPKFDAYTSIKVREMGKKIIIISPHHSIEGTETSVGAFLEYEKIYLELPRLFKDLFFVFRPHPLLIEKLNQLWGKETVEKWLKEYLSNSNTSYSTEGDYLELFKESSALIHDCGSFTAEYLFTGKPCAYVFSKNLNMSKTFTKFGRNCIGVHYGIKNRNDIITFLETVIKQEKDILKKERIKFSKEEVMINYPNASDYILNTMNINLKV